MINKINCPDCEKLVADHMAICPFCNAKMKTQEEIDSDPAIKLAIAKLSITQLEMRKQNSDSNKD